MTAAAYVQGVVTKHPTGTEDYSIRGKFKVPVNFHVGSLGLAQATNATISSVPPTVGGMHLKIGKPCSTRCCLAHLSLKLQMSSKQISYIACKEGQSGRS